MKTQDWIVVRRPGFVTSWWVGPPEIIRDKLERMNEADETGSTEVHIGPVSFVDAKHEFERLQQNYEC